MPHMLHAPLRSCRSLVVTHRLNLHAEWYIPSLLPLLVDSNLVMLIRILRLFLCSFYRAVYEIDTGFQKQCSLGSDMAVIGVTACECDL